MEKESLSSPRCGLVVALHYRRCDDYDRVYLALQNRSAALCVIHCGRRARITNRTYGRGERQPHKVYGIINKRANVHGARGGGGILEIAPEGDVMPEMKHL
jgi:hypothetical protein